MPADIILYAIVAAGLVFWLKSILGTRTGAERERPNPFTTPLDKAKPATAPEASVATGMPMADVIDVEGAPAPLPAHFTISEAAQPGLVVIAREDRSFDLSHFAHGAADAFAFVVESFADGDRATLKELLAAPVYMAFDAALRDRDTSGETVSTEIHAVRKAELLEAQIRDKMIYLKVRFTADETCVIRDKDGVVLSGHPDLVTEMVDVWTFGRSLKAKDPRWLIFETSDGDVTEEHKTPIPDAH